MPVKSSLCRPSKPKERPAIALGKRRGPENQSFFEINPSIIKSKKMRLTV